LGEYNKSISFLKKSINNYNKLKTNNYIKKTTTYQNIAQSYYFLNNKDSAFFWGNKSSKTLSKINVIELEGYLQIELGGICLNLSEIYYYFQDIVEAKKFISKTIELYEKNLPKDHPLLVHSIQLHNRINN